jgi:hypothetical protein
MMKTVKQDTKERRKNPPLLVRKFRILKRYIKQKLGIEKSHYKSDTKMLKAMYKWTRDFEDNRSEFTVMLNGYKDKLITVKSTDEALIKLRGQ